MNKRNIIVCLSVLLIICVLGLGISKAYYVTGEVKNIDELLVPYQEALDEINAELGTMLVIPDDAKESVYNAYKDLTVEEFKERIKQEYLDAMEDLGDNGDVSKSVTSDEPMIETDIPLH